MSTLRSGGCLCGSVRFEARGEPLRTLVCHCKFCQRLTGSTSYAEAMYPIEAVSMSGITPSSYGHRSEGSAMLVYAHFCPRCGSTVSLTFERWPQYRAISRGAFDDPNSVSIGSHIWTESAQTGVVLPADTDCFRQARATLDGTPLAPERHAAPVLARPEV
jgi:hypothetical protein